MKRKICVGLVWFFIFATGISADQPSNQEANKLYQLISAIRQGWGETGINVSAYNILSPAKTLCVAGQEFQTGIGTHAPSETIIDLAGGYSMFEARVGVQQISEQDRGGSVVFKVVVDGQERFNSGVMRQKDAARTLQVPVKGASELCLIVTDAGDGMGNDLANWLEPVLTKDPTAKSAATKKKIRMNIAPFARVITGDPMRDGGCTSNRVQEFCAEDVFLETDLCRQEDGAYKLGGTDSTAACIGLRWLEQRWPAQLSIEFAKGSDVPQENSTKVQVWRGESPWQGGWNDLQCDIVRQGSTLICQSDRLGLMSYEVRKIRWVFTELSGPIYVSRLFAWCPIKFAPLEVSLQFEQGYPDAAMQLELYNAEFDTDTEPKTSCTLTPSQAARLQIRIGESQMDTPSGALLRVRTADQLTTLSLDDLMDYGAVYAPQSGIFLSKGPEFIGLNDYKKLIADKKTVLERVRSLPDQTFQQALEKTRNPIQDNGPMVLSLACDNFKFIVHRDGSITSSRRPDVTPEKGFFPPPLPASIKTKFGNASSAKFERRLDEEYLPIHVVTANDDSITYQQRVYVAPFDASGDSREWPYICDRPICIAEYEITNNADHEATALLILQFSEKTEGAGPLEFIKDQSLVSLHQKGRIFAVVDTTAASVTDADDGSLAVTWKLPPKAQAHCYMSIPTWQADLSQTAALAAKDRLRQALRDHWSKALADSMQVELPDKLLRNTIRASQVHCMLAARNEENGKRIAPWISSTRYGPLESESHSVIRGMAFFGHDQFTARSLDFFVTKYNAEGFLTTGYTLMGTGWHLWTLGEYIGLSQDADWLAARSSEVARVCDWIGRQRQKTRKTDCNGRSMLEYGLMPPGVIADWNTFAYHYCLNAYYYAGLKYAADALASIDYPTAAQLQKAAAEFRTDILNSYRAMQRLAPLVRLQNGASVTGYPEQAYICGPVNIFFPGQDANRSWCYDVELGAHQLVPAGVIDPSAREIGEMLSHMEDVQFLADGWFDYPAEESQADWFNLGGFAKVQPYYCRNAEIYALRDEAKPFLRSYYNMLASLLSTENLSLWEHFNNKGAFNKTHETGYFLYNTRVMLLQERGDDLWLAPMITNNWLKDGLAVRVKNAPTRFGRTSYEIASHVKNGYIDAAIDVPQRTTPTRVVLRLRHPDGRQMKKVFVNDQPHQDFDPAKQCIYLSPKTDHIQIRAQF